MEGTQASVDTSILQQSDRRLHRDIRGTEQDTGGTAGGAGRQTGVRRLQVRYFLHARHCVR
jgi:hypothetical protein